MAQLIEFGGTNQVSVLDIGMSGGSLDTGSTMNLTFGSPNATRQEQASPQVDFVAIQNTGVHGRLLTARGYLKAATHETLNAIEDSIDDHLQTKPTQLANSVTGRTLDKVVLMEWRRIGRRFTAASGAIVQEYEMTFKDTRA
jgi:hypothetical protein